MKYDNVKQNTVYCYYNIKVLLSQFRNPISMSLTLITWTGLENCLCTKREYIFFTVVLCPI